MDFPLLLSYIPLVARLPPLALLPHLLPDLCRNTLLPRSTVVLRLLVLLRVHTLRAGRTTARMMLAAASTFVRTKHARNFLHTELEEQSRRGRQPAAAASNLPAAFAPPGTALSVHSSAVVRFLAEPWPSAAASRLPPPEQGGSGT